MLIWRRLYVSWGKNGFQSFLVQGNEYFIFISTKIKAPPPLDTDFYFFLYHANGRSYHKNNQIFGIRQLDLLRCVIFTMKFWPCSLALKWKLLSWIMELIWLFFNRIAFLKRPLIKSVWKRIRIKMWFRICFVARIQHLIY